ncbi:MAG: beta-lactamase family protein [Chloroflexia bacterium]|nr:beta-lactamase family protein [Chloroflexia bacterium]
MPYRIALIVALLLTLAAPVAVAQIETPAPGPSLATPPGSLPVSPVADLAGVQPLPLVGGRRAAFDAYVVEAMVTFGVPGASVAVVQGGEVVSLQGVGVREAGGTAPVTPDTMMMVGSVTKSFTSLLAATLVDAGKLTWETPVGDLLPGFAVADPEVTARLTVADLFCACTGLPRRDVEIIIGADALTPKALIASVAAFPLTAPLGERYEYSNQAFAIGGYAAAVAAGAAPDDLLEGYGLAMRQRVLGPLGMPNSTFDLAAVLASGDYAVPHAADLSGDAQPLSPIVDDRFATAVAPAGALWSSAREMAHYLQVQLAAGVAPSGTRVVSPENLTRTWAPRTPIPPEAGTPPVLNEAFGAYGMGWGVGSYGGQRLINHSGGTLGFASEVAFLPDADLGVAVLTNGGLGGGLFAFAVQYRLFELLFDQEPGASAQLERFAADFGAQIADFAALLPLVAPEAVTPFLGRYAHPTLGEVELALRGGELVLRTDLFRVELRPLPAEAGSDAGYVFVDPPFVGVPAGVVLQEQADGRPELVLIVEENPEEESLSYAFAPLAAEAPPAASPAP